MILLVCVTCVFLAGWEMVGSDSSTAFSPAPQPARNNGVTKPISLAGPTDADIQRNIELEKVFFFFFLLLLVG